MNAITPPSDTALATSVPDLLEYLADARQLALNRLIEHNNGPNNRLYDHICAAIAIAQQLNDPTE